MAGEWIASCLRDEADLLTGFPFKSAGYTEAPDGLRLLRGDNIVQAALRWDGVKRWPKETAQEFSDYALAAGDVVLAMDRPWIEAGLKFAAISPVDLPCLLVQRTARIRGGNSLDTGFLRYLVGSRQFTQHVLAVQTGTTVPHISARQILDFEFLLPPLSEQKRIAHILGTLDDKIELNRRMNATLESISRAIFKSWFVDFDPVRQKAAGKQPVGMDAQKAALFPDSFEDSEIGEVPKGWGVAEVRDVLSLSREAVDPSEHPTETFDHYSIPAFDSGCWPSPDTGAEIKSQKLLVAPGSVLISKLNPRTPRVWIPQERHQWRPVASTEFLVAIPNETRGVAVPFIFCFASSDSVVEYLASHASGTSNSHQRVRPDDFLSLKTALATNAVLGAFDKFVGPLLQRSSHARSESRTLAALRDTLLPKLLSGEVRVPEAEEAVEEVLR
jgi:type I restriction enzyme, S subunit